MKTIASRFLCRRLTIVFDKHSHCELYPNCYRTQSGVVLVISLIILLLLTIIGLSAMQTTSLEEKMAGNLRDKSLAFQMAESALRAAEVGLPIVSSAFTNTGTGSSGLGSFGYGFYTDTPTISMADTDVSNDSFWMNNPVATSPITGLGNGIHSPDYIIQKLPLIFPLGPVILGVKTKTYQPYKITVRATGGTTNAVVILQSTKIF